LDDQEYWLTGFDTDDYCDFSEERFKELWLQAARKNYLKKEKFYKYAEVFHGEIYPVAVIVFSYLWQKLPVEQPFGYVSIEDVAEYVNCEKETIDDLFQAFQSYGFIKKHSDGLIEVCYKAML